MKSIKPWIEAARLRTLPVGLSGVIAGIGYALWLGNWRTAPAILCAVFAFLAQIASNFANEYFDYKDGIDAPGRVGPRRGVTEGDIRPGAMLAATCVTLGLACCDGLFLIIWGGWDIIPIGAAIAAGVFAYSAGPWPLSRHALGEVAVLVFYGLMPVTLTCWLVSGGLDATVWLGAVACGLMACNILIVNNYRDIDDDRRAHKTTLATLLGLRPMRVIYLFNGLIGVGLMSALWVSLSVWAWIVPLIYIVLHLRLWVLLGSRRGAALNPLLGMTAMLLMGYWIGFLVCAAVR